MKITVTIITLNEEARIRECLESVKWADEIILVDSQSSDRTVEIAKEFTDRVFVEKKWEGYGKAKNGCAAKAENDWIFNIDADETVSVELKDEIRKLMAHGPQKDAYSVKRKNFIGDRWVRRAGWYPDRIIRLYNKKRVSFTEALVHEGVRADGETGALQGWLVHRTYDSLGEYFCRQEHYSTLSAREMLKSGRKAYVPDLVFRPFLSFLKVFLLKKGFLEGYYGLVLAYGQALYTFKKYSKLRKIKQT